MVRGTVIHEDEFQGIGRQVFLENPVYFLLERRNGLFFIQAGNNQGNAFHGNARIIRQNLSGCQQIVPCTQSSLPPPEREEGCRKKGPFAEKKEGSELRQVADVVLVFRGMRVFEIAVPVLAEGPEIIIRIQAVAHFQVLGIGGFGGDGLLAA